MTRKAAAEAATDETPATEPEQAPAEQTDDEVLSDVLKVGMETSTEAEEGWLQQDDARLLVQLTEAFDNIAKIGGSDALRGANMALQQAIGIVAQRILAREEVRRARG